VRLEVDALVIRKLVEDPVVAKRVVAVAFVRFAFVEKRVAAVSTVVEAVLSTV
jgi:hypothetical protein